MDKAIGSSDIYKESPHPQTRSIQSSLLLFLLPFIAQ